MRPKIGEDLNVESLGGETREAFRTDGLHNRLQRYGTARENSFKYSYYLADQNENKLSIELRNCGNYATFREYFTIGQIRLSRICTCKRHLLCPLCAIRRGAKALRVYIARVEHLRKNDPLLIPYMVTLTVKNGPDLNERFKHLTASLRAYHKRRKGTRQHGEILKAKSAVWSYEFTNRHERGTGWHPHVHAIWLCHEKPDAFKLSKEWKSITGDSYIVDVRPLNDADPVASFCEVFKYALKFSDLENSDRLTAYRTLKGKRLQDSFGELRGLDIEPTDADDLLDDLPYIERMFHYIPGVGYKLTQEQKYEPNIYAQDSMLQSLVDMGLSDEQIVEFMKNRRQELAAAA